MSESEQQLIKVAFDLSSNVDALRKNMSKTGSILCGIYAAVIIICIAISASADGDFKGQFVFLQLPIALQLALVQELGLIEFFKEMTWFPAYLILGLPTFGLLYLLGLLMDGRRYDNTNPTSLPKERTDYRH
jgi:hypothetical protein